MTTCNRCSLCCYIRHNGKVKKCKHLVILSNNKSLCRVYSSRLGKTIGEIDGVPAKCVLRESYKKNFKGCPFNVSGQEFADKGDEN